MMSHNRLKSDDEPQPIEIDEPQPIEEDDVPPVPIPRIPVPGNRPVPVPRRSQRKRASPDRYGEWVKAHVADVANPDSGGITNTNNTNSHEVLGLLLDKFLR